MEMCFGDGQFFICGDSVMRKSLIVVAFGMACLSVSCNEGTPMGSEGGKCYGDNTCDIGLQCLSDLCVEDEDCVPDCGSRECGLDPVCGRQNCGTCDDGYSCQDGECVEGACEPDCGSRECGLDPVCGTQNCGTCGEGSSCQSGQCVENSVPAGMVLIPAGSFWMGCNTAVDTDCDDDENPYHEVALSTFYMDKTEVTVTAYGECVTAADCVAPSTSESFCNWGKSGQDNHPVNCVNWDQATAYCEWAGKRLPTEAEWEKAARGTEGWTYPWGNEPATCEYAVMDDDGEGCGTGHTWEVCSRSPAGDSPYGLCDMSGNVWEWVSDWHDYEYYKNSPSLNPTGPASGSYRVIRGGDFSSPEFLAPRASDRSSSFQSRDDVWGLGFRCARSQPDACFPACGKYECGFDPVCGVQYCGTCGNGYSCDGGECVETVCVPDCGKAECGLDPVCGTSCGICGDGFLCDDGECVVHVEYGEMVLIPAGPFWMGCNDSVDYDCDADEFSYHEVTLDAYYIDRTEVTRPAFKQCVDAGGCDYTGNFDGASNVPMLGVDWNDAVAFCEWAGKRLPTEAEWEKAARGTDGRKYPWGNETATCDYAVMEQGEPACGSRHPWLVCSKSPAGDSPYGLCDMTGNAEEWVSDWYSDNYYENSPASNPMGPELGIRKVQRGGCYYYDYGLRSSDRRGSNPLQYASCFGFRCVRDAL